MNAHVSFVAYWPRSMIQCKYDSGFLLLNLECGHNEEGLSGREVGSGTEAQLPSALNKVEFSWSKTKPGLVSPESQEVRPAQLYYVVSPSLIAELLRRVAGARHR